MVPLTEARIGYVLRGERRETKVETLIVNRELIEWVEQVVPDQVVFPIGPTQMVAKPA
jgi:hypothetical protein